MTSIGYLDGGIVVLPFEYKQVVLHVNSMSLSLTQLHTEIHDTCAKPCRLVRRRIAGQKVKYRFVSDASGRCGLWLEKTGLCAGLHESRGRRDRPVQQKGNQCSAGDI